MSGRFKVMLDFLKTSEGGKKLSITTSHYRCIFRYNEGNFSCVFSHDEKSIQPGSRVYGSISLIYPHYIQDKLKVGSEFFLAENRIVAKGEILEIFGEFG